jgi:hypothetical protein
MQLQLGCVVPLCLHLGSDRNCIDVADVQTQREREFYGSVNFCSQTGGLWGQG